MDLNRIKPPDRNVCSNKFAEKYVFLQWLHILLWVILGQQQNVDSIYNREAATQYTTAYLGKTNLHNSSNYLSNQVATS